MAYLKLDFITLSDCMAEKIVRFLFVFLMISGVGNLYAAEPVAEASETSSEHSNNHGKEKFDAGKMIIEHVIDSHE